MAPLAREAARTPVFPVASVSRQTAAARARADHSPPSPPTSRTQPWRTALAIAADVAPRSVAAPSGRRRPSVSRTDVPARALAAGVLVDEQLDATGVGPAGGASAAAGAAVTAGSLAGLAFGAAVDCGDFLGARFFVTAVVGMCWSPSAGQIHDRNIFLAKDDHGPPRPSITVVVLL
jgi:hypothetical protein